MKSDADGLFKLMDANVTRGNLKNLVTDKPSPITVGLAQKSDADNLSTLFDSNVTRGALKYLVTYKPAPITVKLAQKSDADNLSSLFDSNVTRGARGRGTRGQVQVATHATSTRINGAVLIAMLAFFLHRVSSVGLVEAVAEAVTLAVRYLPDRFLPDKAIDVIDEAGAFQQLQSPSKRKKAVSYTHLTLPTKA